MEGLVRCSANYVPLSPISFLERSASVYRDRTSIVYGSTVKYTWKETRDRCVKLASALTQLGISRDDVVAVLAPNVPATYELHFSIPMAGAVICPLNTRYDSTMVSILLKHSEAKIIFVDYQLYEVARAALDDLILTSNTKTKQPPLLVLIPESDTPSNPATSKTISFCSGNYLEYESLIGTGQLDFEIRRPNDEWDPISLNYTSGTTSTRPKEVVYNHRGAYLNSLATILLTGMGQMPVYLWTVPMFHCNGWCLAWGVAAQGGTNVCLRDVSAQVIFDSIALHKVTNMGGAPTILNMIANAPPSIRKPLPFKVGVITGGAAPPPEVLFKVEELGFIVTHAYGMTETYGAGTICTWKPEWDSLPPHERAKLKSRHGLQHLIMEEVDIKDPVTMKSVPADAKTIGEAMFRGNTVMSGYFKDLKATEEAFKGGWFRTGDLGVKHPDGYIEIKDRSNDNIISGGENVSTIEVESVLFSHPSILEAAVLGKPDDHLGEIPCAFVKLKEGQDADAQDVIKYCQDRMPLYMVPPTVIFDDLPKTSTGKTQKYVLREKAKAMESLTKMNNNV